MSSLSHSNTTGLIFYQPDEELRSRRRQAFPFFYWFPQELNAPIQKNLGHSEALAFLYSGSILCVREWSPKI